MCYIFQADLAKAQLNERGLKVIIEKTEDITVRPNYVIKSVPSEGKTVPKGSTVTLYVSTGSASDEMTMEDYRGTNVSDAIVKAGDEITLYFSDGQGT